MKRRTMIFGFLFYSMGICELGLSSVNTEGQVHESKARLLAAPSCFCYLGDWRSANGNSCTSLDFITVLDYVMQTEGICSCPFECDPILGKLFPVPAGSFTQGAFLSEPCKNVNDRPQFIHQFNRDLLVMETEITRGMWAELKILQNTLKTDRSNTDNSPELDYPSQNMTWHETLLFANLISIEHDLTPSYYKDASFQTVLNATNLTQAGFFCDFDANGYRLPTEGEWEYFARAGTTGYFSIPEPAYALGSCYSCTPGLMQNLETVATFCANETGTIEPAGSKEPNDWGIKDVHGNVFEWCWDYFNIYTTSTKIDYAGPSSGSVRVQRSGAWQEFPQSLRSSSRAYRNAYDRDPDSGFRLVRLDSN